MAFEPHSSQPTVQPPDKTTEGRAVNTGKDLLVTGDQGTLPLPVSYPGRGWDTCYLPLNLVGEKKVRPQCLIRPNIPCFLFMADGHSQLCVA